MESETSGACPVRRWISMGPWLSRFIASGYLALDAVEEKTRYDGSS